MKMDEHTRDLTVLVADSNIEHGIRGLLSRPEALQVSPVTFQLFKHPHHDPGCFREAGDFLRPLQSEFRFALVVFDREGCGSSKTREQLEQTVERDLVGSGWHGRSAVVVIDPELEAWVWSDSPEVDKTLGWVASMQPTMRQWLGQQELLTGGATKPEHPKVAMEAVLRQTKYPRSAALYYELASRVGLARCTDASFLKLKRTLQDWFPA